MRRASLLLAVAALLLGAVSGGVLAGEATTLKGSFVWTSRGDSGDLAAVFTPTGEDQWDVDFNFEFRGKPHTYSGTAEGSLTEGPLKGTVKNEKKERTFTFEGEFKNGKFEGKHAEIEGEKSQSTGTLMLKG